MANRPLIAPRIHARTINNKQETIGGQLGYPEGATNWNEANVTTAVASTKGTPTFLVVTSGLLVPVATAGALVSGFINGDTYHNQVTTIDPPYARKGNRHFPFNLQGMQFLMSVSRDNAGGNASDVLANITLGAQYGLFRNSTAGRTFGFQTLDLSNTTQKLFTVVDIPLTVDGEANSTERNPIVVVQVIPSVISIP